MYPTLPLAPVGYTLHIITSDQRRWHPSRHIARLMRPDGSVSCEWVFTRSRWRLQQPGIALRAALVELLDLDDDDELPIYYATVNLPTGGLPRRYGGAAALCKPLFCNILAPRVFHLLAIRDVFAQICLPRPLRRLVGLRRRLTKHVSLFTVLSTSTQPLERADPPPRQNRENSLCTSAPT